MGHININNPEMEYSLLQQRLSQKVQDNPASPTLMKILSMLFSPEDANLARRLPHNLAPVETLSKNLKIPIDELNERLTEMARRGVVFDMEHNGRRYVTLMPVVIGFFEFVFMRTRPDLPMDKLAQLFEQYLTENEGALARSIWQGQTQLARTFVREEAIPDNDHAEVLDYERATRIVSTATSISVGMCQCQHIAMHHGKACEKPQEICLSFNYAAESMVRNGITRSITKKEAMGILDNSKESNLIQIGDNVKHKASFICNCCSCCCHMLRGIRNYKINRGVMTSNWIMEVNISRCKGCGECARACPVDAVRINQKMEGGKKKKWAVRDEDVCLGCGLCSTVCKNGGAVMKARPSRVIVPENIFDQRVAMAIERGKLADLLFDDPEKLSHRALGRVISALEKTSAFKAAMASGSLKSAFLNAIINGAKIKAGELTELFS